MLGVNLSTPSLKVDSQRGRLRRRVNPHKIGSIPSDIGLYKPSTQYNPRGGQDLIYLPGFRRLRWGRLRHNFHSHYTFLALQSDTCFTQKIRNSNFGIRNKSKIRISIPEKLFETTLILNMRARFELIPAECFARASDSEFVSNKLLSFRRLTPGLVCSRSDKW